MDTKITRDLRRMAMHGSLHGVYSWQEYLAGHRPSRDKPVGGNPVSRARSSTKPRGELLSGIFNSFVLMMEEELL